ncbi:ATPase-like protein [Leptomonas pyrrhocoris]|uniref:ATPase-like protein n=1 Tax=Leptomonas pyrrhocoris TaxID=157538 RepID=A0A0M9G9E2_LEPPY|nr:ATPase-like protein [Leptomonas pyrrhocoris]KPA85279.1 ATPase-like protein [Leptomonas pyrrhocoris]|eukprot:XP_015663718.1 ATPase-like protein [Leptomonas pyrrhocoris]
MTTSKFLVVVEVNTTANRSEWAELSTLARSYVRVQASRRLAHGHRPPFLPGAFVSLTEAPSLLTETIFSLRVCDVSFPLECTWADVDDVDFRMRLYQLVEGDATRSNGEQSTAATAAAGPVWSATGKTYALSGDHDEEDTPAFTVTPLPHASLEGQWESLYYGDSEEASILFKRDIVSYVDTAMRFARAGVNPHLISWNRLVLFYGPPGTGKTSLCRALAQKLAIRFSHSGYPRACLLDINAHSLFSRWFSESGKQVLQLFEHIQCIADDSDCLVCCVMDEVESLAAARASAMKGNEPSDSIRVVNALLTQIDRLQRRENILVLSTSNLTDAIDEALLDRADKRVYVGPPGLHARSVLLQSSVQELLEKGLVAVPAADDGGATSTRIGVDLELKNSVSEANGMGTKISGSSAEDGRGVHLSAADAHPEESSDSEMQNEEACGAVLSASAAMPSHMCERDGQTDVYASLIANSASSINEAKPIASSRQHIPDCPRPRYTVTTLLRHVAMASEGLNGRTLKKLPFLAYGKCVCSGAGHAELTANSSAVGLAAFLEALFEAARQAAAEAPSKQMTSE